jgi:hypothetical protein
MITMYPVVAFLLLLVLPNAGYLLAVRSGSPGWVGLFLGFGSWVVLLSGHFISLMVRDWLERTRFPKRQGVGPWVVGAAIAVFMVSSTLTFWLSLIICRH